MIPLKFGQNAHDSTQSPRLDPPLRSCRDIWPRLSGRTRHNQVSNGVEFLVINWNRSRSEPDDLKQPRRLQDRQSVTGIKLAEQIPREKRPGYFFDSVGPAFLG